MSQTESPDAGLFPDPYAPAPGSRGPIEAAAVSTIAALRTAGGVDATHALKVELIQQGARALDREMRREKVTVAAIALFSKVTDLADALPTVQQAVNEKFKQIADALAHADD